jgi:hypothetical protein
MRCRGRSPSRRTPSRRKGLWDLLFGLAIGLAVIIGQQRCAVMALQFNLVFVRTAIAIVCETTLRIRPEHYWHCQNGSSRCLVGNRGVPRTWRRAPHSILATGRCRHIIYRDTRGQVRYGGRRATLAGATNDRQQQEESGC